jgi:SAM-dependent methyltransferase
LLYASHVFEHIKAFPALMRECHRVLKPRGVLTLKVPAVGCRAAISDPTHCWQFAPETWGHFDKESNIGFDTLGMRKVGFILKWNEIIEWRRPGIDDGRPGSFFTENIVDFEKDGPLHEWEEALLKMQQEDEGGKCQEKC